MNTWESDARSPATSDILEKGPPGIGVPVDVQCRQVSPDGRHVCRKHTGHPVERHWEPQPDGNDVYWIDEKPPARTIGVVGIGSEEAVGATPPDRSYQGPAFGDVRDVLVQAPNQPYSDLVPSYICSDIFPAKHESIRRHAPDAVSVLEIGGFYGHFLLTALEAAPSIRQVWWADNQHDDEHSNLWCKQNVEWWARRLAEGDKVSMRYALDAYSLCLGVLEPDFGPGRIDVVHVDGCHTFDHALADITMGLMLKPKLLIVDDTIAHDEVRAAVRFVAVSTGLTPVYRDTVNGYAEIVP